MEVLNALYAPLTAASIIGSLLTGDEIIPYLVEVELLGNPKGNQLSKDDAFLRVRETLTRIGIEATDQENTLYQTCHLLHKCGRYYVVHYKTMYLLDGGFNTITEGDIGRQNRIIKLLGGWNMIKVVNPAMIEKPITNLHDIKVVKYAEKADWHLQPKYNIGKKEKELEHVAT